MITTLSDSIALGEDGSLFIPGVTVPISPNSVSIPPVGNLPSELLLRCPR